MLTLQFQYKPLFKINLRHNYFQENILKNYQIQTDKKTLELFDSLGLLLKRSETGIDILADNCQPELLRLRFEALRNKSVKLQLLLFIKDPFFKNYSNIPFDTNQKILYFSNEHLSGADNGDLHNQEYVTEDDLFKLNNSNGLEDKPNLNIPAYKKGIPLGLIELVIDDKIIERITNSLMDGDLSDYNYNISFDSRPVVWKYMVVSGYSKKLKGLKVVGQQDKSGVKFTDNQEVVVNEDKTALVFTSNKPIKFQEYYEYDFQLKRGEGVSGGGKTLIKRLQYASIEKLKPLYNDERSNYCSEIFIYI